MKGIGCAAAWIVTDTVVIAGLYFTESIDCLWFLLIPFFATII